MEDIENYVLHMIERFMAGRRSKRYGTVTSWDADNHLAKVQLEPEGIESGWIPVHTMAAGDGYGHMTGLSSGDHVEITHQEGEFEAGAITARVHSKVDKPPKVESGEQLFKAKFGQYIKFPLDGSVQIFDKSGKASIVLDGQGGIQLKAETMTHDVTGSNKIKGSNVEINP